MKDKKKCLRLLQRNVGVRVGGAFLSSDLDGVADFFPMFLVFAWICFLGGGILISNWQE